MMRTMGRTNKKRGDNTLLSSAAYLPSVDHVLHYEKEWEFVVGFGIFYLASCS